MYVDNAEYAHGRLYQTIVRLNTGVPVYCEAVRNGGEEFGRSDGSLILWYREVSLARYGSMQKKPIEEFNLASPPLGYTNYEGNCHFVSRLPMRRDWRQGIRQSNLVLSYRGRQRHYSFSSLNPLTVPILKMYPSYKETVNRVEDIYIDCAFTRNFSLDERGRLWYKGKQTVGEDREGVPQLFSKFFWLKELLAEEMEDAGDA